jgi:hypothetical protein
MPGYAFPRARRDALVDGTQLGLIAPRREGGPAAAHAIVGDPVQLRLARAGGDPVEHLRPRVCILRARLVLTADRLVRALDVRFRSHDQHEPEAERAARLIAAAEQGAAGDLAAARDALARLLGADDWADLFAQATRQGRKTPSTEPQLERELIVWSAS